MKILKSKRRRTGYKLVGVSLPLPEHNYLTLYCLAKGVTKTEVLREALAMWSNLQKQKKVTAENLVIEITLRLSERWEILKKENPDLLLEEYIEDVIYELSKKELSSVYIKSIIEKINEKD